MTSLSAGGPAAACWQCRRGCQGYRPRHAVKLPRGISHCTAGSQQWQALTETAATPAAAHAEHDAAGAAERSTAAGGARGAARPAAAAYSTASARGRAAEPAAAG